jgi:hypothetical protein
MVPCFYGGRVVPSFRVAPREVVRGDKEKMLR